MHLKLCPAFAGEFPDPRNAFLLGHEIFAKKCFSQSAAD